MQYSPGARVARRGARVARGSSIVLALALASCSSNEEGRLGAIGTGDVSAPAVARIAPADNADACAACRGAASNRRSTLSRTPYLQRVTANDAVVAWTSAGGASATVQVETPDGTQKASFDAAIDKSAPMPDIVSQWPTPISFKPVRQWTAAVSGLSPDTTYCYTVMQDGVPATAPAELAARRRPGDGRTGAVRRARRFGRRRQRSARADAADRDRPVRLHDPRRRHRLRQRDARRVREPLLRASTRRCSRSGRSSRPAATTSTRPATPRPFRQVFVLPENGGPGGVERWYSYDWGDIHFVALDTERTGPAQAAWLEADLTANKLPWTIVYGHKPPHSSAGTLRPAVAAVLRAGAGGPPRCAGAERPRAPLRALRAARRRHLRRHRRRRPRRARAGQPRGRLAFAEAVIHFVVVTVDGDTLTLHAIDATGREFDSTVIPRRSF